VAHGPSIRSFGASPNELLRDIFGAPESIGRRASEFLNIMLVAVSHEKQTLNIWGMNGPKQEIYQHQDFRRLSQVISATMKYSREEYAASDREEVSELSKHILNTLQAAKKYTQQRVDHSDITMDEVIKTLLELIGPGSYQLEFRRRLLALRERRSVDAS
jgi:hypothetical protein